jgi:uncharacterized damage-inducible protein DinB
MNSADMRRLYAYTDWANERMLAAIDGLSEEQRTRTIPSSFPSILETLHHIAFAEWLWLRRWQGESPMALPGGASLGELRDRLRAVADERRAYLDALADDAMAGQISYRSIKGDPFTMNLGDVLVHCANHSTYHRGQLVTMLRQVGVKPPGTDYTEFVRTLRSSE